ncbi:hypothetical protein PSA7680_01656 [Pseudoruegeria aquimaris]|uniref:Hemerythrin-like domain-containing protein n=1 Tax=Pseudoruegeria aquimaris TaxID=393663 RepID=A0A1Y5SAB4_9RHOB|nr:hemerythrin domain-containing protein [Pseudoruegeria aquimaris]SLN34975.1 hypothetical protein PSA7680_01656 [Pseudoruegeria aquimaris]
MTQYSIHTRSGLPDEWQLLLRAHPRDSWPDHPNFARSIRNWMGAHQMFRDLGALTEDDTRSVAAGEMELARFAGRLSHFGGLLVANLHGHHGWEDRSFFPELSPADPRFDAGLETLESDHLVLDETLERFTRRANRVVQLAQLDEAQSLEEARHLQDDAAAITRFLARHLADEEDLVVPILLHHGLRS